MSKTILGHLPAMLAALTLSVGIPSVSLADEKPINLAVINDMSGPLSDSTGEGSVIAAQLAIDDFGGSVLGRPIKLLSADHQNKADLAASITRRWIDVDDVQAIIDGGNSTAGLVIQEIVKEKKRIALFTSPATSDLTGKACSPFGFAWTYDTYALASTAAKALVAQGADTWFFVTSDYTFGHALERDATKFVEDAGGKVTGSVRHPMNTSDFSSYILQAQTSGAKIIGLANSGDDALNAIKQSAEFGVVQSGQRLGGLLLLLNQIHGLGLEAAAGTLVSEAYYWDQDDGTRAFADRFEKLAHKKPNALQASVYSAVNHYLKSVKAAGTIDAPAVAKEIKALPVNDFMSKDVKVREDGRVMRNMYLFEVKKPEESKGAWDYYKQLSVVPGEQAFRPLADGGCKLEGN